MANLVDDENILGSLPDEIMVEILIRLPVKSLCRFKAVNRTWLELISSKRFIKQQLAHAKKPSSVTLHKLMYIRFPFSTRVVYSRMFDFSSFRKELLSLPVVDTKRNVEACASCDGMLLLYVGWRNYVLWNPSTKESRWLNGLHGNMFVDNCFRLYGIAYDHAIDGYKVISAVHTNGNPNTTIISVYDCKTWTITYTTTGTQYYICRNQQSANVNNETPHWLVNRHQARNGCAIIYYDVADRIFKEVATPDWAENAADVELRAHKGMLCLVRYLRGYADVWAMTEYGRRESWTIIYPSVRSVGLFDIKPLGLTHGGSAVLEVERRMVDVYDPRSRVFSGRNIEVPGGDAFRSAIYVESLVSPFDWIEDDE